MLISDPGITVVGEAGEGQEAVEKAERLEPDVVLSDIRMPGLSGIEVTRQIKQLRPATVVILLTMYDSDMYVVEALRAGAAGYLLKDSSRELLCEAIHAAVEGSTMVRSRLLRQALQGVPRLSAPSGPVGRAPPPGRRATGQLTGRELDVLRLLTEGYANKEIAKELYLAEVTVKKRVQSIIAKLGASDRTHAAILAVRQGLVE